MWNGSGRAQLASADLDVEALVAEAVTSRPDLRAAELAVTAALERAELAGRGFWNMAAVLPDINSRGHKGGEAGPGLQFTLPLFHRNEGALARAEAQAEQLRRQYVRMRDTAVLEVRQAYIRLAQAEQVLTTWQDEIIPQTEAALTSSRRALEEDGVSLLLVLETSRQLITARQRELEAAAQVRRAIAELERSVGRRLATLREGEILSGSQAIPLPDTAEEGGEEVPAPFPSGTLEGP
jgi:cobalt-zinc-cadmium efflux system outer membrane protein